MALLLPLLGCVAYLTLWERKAIGWSQIRPGPNRTGPGGLLQPIADAVKLIFKEIKNSYVFWSIKKAIKDEIIR